MPTMQEIQEDVNQAQVAIRNRNFDRVKTVIWPEIKRKLGQPIDNIVWPVRRKMGFIIHKRLDEQDLQGGPFTPIDVEQLKTGLEAGRLQAPEPAQVNKWLPY